MLLCHNARTSELLKTGRFFVTNLETPPKKNYQILFFGSTVGCFQYINEPQTKRSLDMGWIFFPIFVSKKIKLHLLECQGTSRFSKLLRCFSTVGQLLCWGGVSGSAGDLLSLPRKNHPTRSSHPSMILS